MIKIRYSHGIAQEISVDGVLIQNCTAIDLHMDTESVPCVRLTIRVIDGVDIETDADVRVEEVHV